MYGHINQNYVQSRTCELIMLMQHVPTTIFSEYRMYESHYKYAKYNIVAKVVLDVHFIPEKRDIHVPRHVADRFAAPDLQGVAVQRVCMKLFMSSCRHSCLTFIGSICKLRHNHHRRFIISCITVVRKNLLSLTQLSTVFTYIYNPSPFPSSLT